MYEIFLIEMILTFKNTFFTFHIQDGPVIMEEGLVDLPGDISGDSKVKVPTCKSLRTRVANVIIRLLPKS